MAFGITTTVMGLVLMVATIKWDKIPPLFPGLGILLYVVGVASLSEELGHSTAGVVVTILVLLVMAILLLRKARQASTAKDGSRKERK